MKAAFLTVDWSYPPGWDKRHPEADTRKPTVGGSGFYRMQLPSWALHHYAGVETFLFGDLTVTKAGEICPRDWHGNVTDGWDTIVFQRWMGEGGDVVTRRAQACGQRIVNDVDDWYWGLDPSNAAFGTTHPKVSPHVNRNHYRRTLAASDSVIFSTSYLAGRMPNLPCPTVVIDNAVNLAMFPRYPVRDTRRPNLGWVGGTPWRSGDLETLNGILPDVMTKHGLRFMHGGHIPGKPQAATMLRLPPGRCCVRPIQPMATYPELFEQIDVGLALLADVPFNRAKSSLKAKEYSASGVPFIAAALDPYVGYGEGVLCQRSKDWKRAVEQLIEPAERRRLADKAYERVQSEDIGVRWTDWASALGVPTQIETRT